MSGTSKSDASLQHDLISAPVQLVSSGREEFTVCMKRSSRRRALLRGEGLTNPEPRQGKFHGGHRCAESLGGGAFLLDNRLLGHMLSAERGCMLAAVGGYGGCRGHGFSNYEVRKKIQ
jgi:hypothetical protein